MLEEKGQLTELVIDPPDDRAAYRKVGSDYPQNQLPVHLVHLYPQ